MRKLLMLSLASLFFVGQLLAQKTITGKVMDEKGDPLSNVTVQVKGTGSGTSTSSDGSYSIVAPSSSTILVFTAVDMVPVERNVGSSTNISIVMKSVDKSLQEVVVVGYGAQLRKTKTQAVSTVKAEAFENFPVISATQVLQGQAAGVNMVNSSGVLGANSSVRVRGAASIAGNGQPLYVIDGVPMNDNIFSSAQGGGTGLNPLVDINPNDIENISVLKDAAAVAIYGSRGTNGVILIKTKKGRANQKTKVNLDLYTGSSKPTDLMTMVNADQWKSLSDAYRSARSLAAFTPPAGGFDWVDAVVRTGQTKAGNISVTGGSANTRFFIGGSLYNETGFTIGNELTRMSLRSNIEHDVSKKVKVGANISLANTISDRMGVENNTFAPLTSSYLQLPYVQPRDANGNLVNTGFIQNVIAIEKLNTNKFNSRRDYGNIYSEIDLIPGMKFRSDWGADLVTVEERTRVVNLITPGGTASRFVTSDNKWLTTNTLTYDKSMGDHKVGALLGHSYETSRFDDITVAASGFASDRLPNVGSGSTPTTTTATRSFWALESFIGRANYSFKDRYLFEVSGRRDGSSRFGTNNRYGNFYAVSGGWILSDESFLANSKHINFLKLTTSYGTSGNDRIGNFPYQAIYGGGVGADYNGSAGLTPTQTPNPDLSWEEARQFDVGVVAALFNNRVNIEANWYLKNTINNLVDLPLPFTTGFPSQTRNIGEVENKGVDLMINTVNVRNKDFEWKTSLNMGFVKNTVLSLPENRDEAGRNFLQGSASQRAIVGHSLNTFYLIRYSGVNPQTGQAEWLDKDGKPTTSPLATDRKIVGSAIPKFTGGFTNSAKYKGFDLNVFFNFSYGNKVFIDGLRFTENPIMTNGFNKSTRLLNYWTKPGDVAFAPGLATTTNQIFAQRSTLQMQDGSYVRLKNISLGYNLPKSILEKSKAFSAARFYVMGHNLFIIQAKDFRGPDAEVSANGGNNLVQGESFFALPQAKTLTVGINVTF